MINHIRKDNEKYKNNIMKNNFSKVLFLSVEKN
jgi:hypothetical protein